MRSHHATVCTDITNLLISALNRFIYSCDISIVLLLDAHTSSLSALYHRLACTWAHIVIGHLINNVLWCAILYWICSFSLSLLSLCLNMYYIIKIVIKLTFVNLSVLLHNIQTHSRWQRHQRNTTVTNIRRPRRQEHYTTLRVTSNKNPSLPVSYTIFSFPTYLVYFSIGHNLVHMCCVYVVCLHLCLCDAENRFHAYFSHTYICWSRVM